MTSFTGGAPSSCERTKRRTISFPLLLSSRESLSAGQRLVVHSTQPLTYRKEGYHYGQNAPHVARFAVQARDPGHRRRWFQAVGGHHDPPSPGHRGQGHGQAADAPHPRRAGAQGLHRAEEAGGRRQPGHDRRPARQREAHERHHQQRRHELPLQPDASGPQGPHRGQPAPAPGPLQRRRRDGSHGGRDEGHQDPLAPQHHGCPAHERPHVRLRHPHRVRRRRCRRRRGGSSRSPARADRDRPAGDPQPAQERQRHGHRPRPRPRAHDGSPDRSEHPHFPLPRRGRRPQGLALRQGGGDDGQGSRNPDHPHRDPAHPRQQRKVRHRRRSQDRAHLCRAHGPEQRRHAEHAGVPEEPRGCGPRSQRALARLRRVREDAHARCPGSAPDPGRAAAHHEPRQRRRRAELNY